MKIDLAMMKRMIGPNWPLTKQEREVLEGFDCGTGVLTDYFTNAKIDVSILDALVNGLMVPDGMKDGKPLFSLTPKGQQRAGNLFKDQQAKDNQDNN